MSCAEANNQRYIGSNHSQSRQSPPPIALHSPYQSQDPQRVVLYHDSNLKWCSNSAIEKTVHSMLSNKPHPISKIKMEKNYTPRLEDMLSAATHNDHSNAIVVFAVMTNNAKAGQPVLESQAIFSRVLNIIKTQTSPQNLIVLESPPSLNFDIFPYNYSMFQVCKSSGISFAPNLLSSSDIKTDGLHILPHSKHLMVKSLSAAIKKIDPHIFFNICPTYRRPAWAQ